MNVTSHSLEETEVFAAAWLATLARMDAETSPRACVVGLYGNLGSGKTAFTQIVARLLGIKESVTSPTYVIEKKYEINQSNDGGLANSLPTAFKHLIHIDAYRLEKPSELVSLGWDALIADPMNLILVEWPERVAEIMPSDHLHLKFTFINDTTRQIEG